MIKPKAFQAVVFALVAGVLIGAAADRAVSMKQLVELSPSQANRQYQRDLLSILQPMQRYPEGTRAFLGGVHTFTKAIATDYEALCQHDMIMLQYRPNDPNKVTSDSAFRPVGISSVRAYRFVAVPRLEDAIAVDQGRQHRRPTDQHCRPVDQPYRPGDLSEWFQANSPADAMYAGFAMLALQEWGKRPGNTFANCTSLTDTAGCNREGTTQLGLDRLVAFSYCQPRAKGETCVEFGDYGPHFTIHAKATGQMMTANDILSVSYEVQNIIVT
ncbi:hypothetical protein [Novosphingobium sp.]|uniref:hypothetical protein n=1 Tax=Novosphingobium sp. TaxID=1874826 RepID=UPI0025E7EE3F|nr:hypothetical protein [Novosphingobium sp.]MCC6926404.1 hypothetical protein [Novosphingobium sp.]